MSTKKEEFIARQAKLGHFAERRAEAAAALVEAYCYADADNRTTLLAQLTYVARDYAETVHGWDDRAGQALRDLLASQLRGG